MNNLLKGSLAVAVAFAALPVNSQAQTVAVKGIGSSALFLELGLAASASTSATPAGLGATCLWTENTSTVIATDTSATSSLTDTGNAFVAWTPGSGSCAAPVSPTIYSYLQTDSVVGNRCLFNGTACTVKYPTNGPASANIIMSSGEVPLPATIANAINSAAVNVAGTDIRPEDAEFAIARALKPCNTAVASGSQYLGLGYANGSTINASTSVSTTSKFNVINFSLPASFSVTPVGAVPVVVVLNSPTATTGFNVQSGSAPAITSITSKALAQFLDGTNSYTGQALASPAASGLPTTVVLREPLSGTYNTMEYNVPNTTGNKTSQDVGTNQPAAQKACSGTSAINPLTISTTSGGVRERAIGTGQELSVVAANGSNPTTQSTLGFGFWSVGNFKGFTGSGTTAFARYVQVDGIDPLLNSSTPYSTYNGTIPLAGTTEISKVDLSTTGNGSYPIWSQIRLVNTGSSPLAAVTSLANASQNFVSKGTTTSRPDYVQASLLSVVRSHFIPPAGVGEPTTAANGHGSLSSSACTATEAGGDVGGVVITLAADSRYCSQHGVTTGQTNMRR